MRSSTMLVRARVDEQVEPVERTNRTSRNHLIAVSQPELQLIELVGSARSDERKHHQEDRERASDLHGASMTRSVSRLGFGAVAAEVPGEK